MRKLVMLVAAAVSAWGLGGSLRSSQAAASTANNLVGTWAWVSVDTTAPNGAETQPFGPTPQGYLIFDANGRFAWLISRPGRPKFAADKRDQGTAEENRATVQGSLAYAGTYSVSGQTLVLKIEASTYPNEEGHEQRRVFTLTEDGLKWTNPVVSTGARGVAILKRVR
jgi:hypothetical protein